MEDFIVKKVIESLSYENSEERFKGKPLTKDEIKLSEPNQGRLIFIDGGNAPIFSTPSFDVSFIRVFGCLSDNNKIVERIKKEYYLLTYTKDDCFECELYNFSINNYDKNKLNENIVIKRFKIKFDEPSLRIGNQNIRIQKIPEAIRANEEMQFAIELNEKHNNISFVLDGNLEDNQIFKKKNIQKLKEVCEKNNNKLSSLSKTCSLLTDSGKSIISALRKFMKHVSYYNIGKIDSNEVFIVKLHQRSNYLFRLDGDNIISELIHNSIDPSFLGYPYGLIVADKFARITNKEIEYMKTKLFLKLKDKDLILQENSLNAHNILDNIS